MRLTLLVIEVYPFARNEVKRRKYELTFTRILRRLLQVLQGSQGLWGEIDLLVIEVQRLCSKRSKTQEETT